MFPLFKRAASLIRLFTDRLLPLHLVRIGNSRAWLSKQQADVMLELNRTADSIHFAQPLHGKKVMAVTTHFSNLGLMRLEYLLADKSARDALVETKNDEYGVIESDITGKVIVDFGANVGDFSIACALKGAFVHAFEPNPDLYELLQRNFKSNQVESRVKSYPAGVWRESGRVEAAYDPQGSGAGRMLKPGENRTFRRTIEFDLIRASDAIKSVGDSIDFLKVDIEGAEYEVFEELINSGEMSRVQAGAIEYHSRLENLAETLLEAGFEVSVLEKDGSYGIVLFSRS
jgi:FkbM family methyltransferase